jgi:hypothetical protein
MDFINKKFMAMFCAFMKSFSKINENNYHKLSLPFSQYSAEKEWGDGIRGLALSAARYSLLRLEEGKKNL